MILQHVLKWKICHLCTSAEFRKREVSWQHRLKTFFPNGLVYKKLARRNIFCFINSISMLVVLTYCYHYSYSCSSSYLYYHYYYHYYYNFIVNIVTIIVVFSIISVTNFILFNFIFHCYYYYDFCLHVCVTCMCPLVNFFC